MAINKFKQNRLLIGNCSRLTNFALAVCLSITVPFHQIPSRRLLMRVLWNGPQKSVSVTSQTSKSLSRVQKPPRIFQRCRPCIVQKNENLKLDQQPFTLTTSDQSKVAFLKFLYFSSERVIQPSYHLSSVPSRSPPSAL